MHEGIALEKVEPSEGNQPSRATASDGVAVTPCSVFPDCSRLSVAMLSCQKSQTTPSIALNKPGVCLFLFSNT